MIQLSYTIKLQNNRRLTYLTIGNATMLIANKKAELVLNTLQSLVREYENKIKNLSDSSKMLEMESRKLIKQRETALGLLLSREDLPQDFKAEMTEILTNLN